MVVGAGFAGIAAALTLAERGARVLLCEALKYPGGCASTFTHHGWDFETGATLFSGFGPGQLMRQWIDRHRLDVGFSVLDPMITLKTPEWTLAVPPDRDELVRRLVDLTGAPPDRLASFFDEQGAIADTLWALFDDPTLLPPLDARALVRHLGRAPSYLPLLRHVGRPLSAMVRRHRLDGVGPLRTYLDALCQITVQCSAADAEAPFALAATDYAFRGTGHVHGGIGVLARALCGAIVQLGGEVRLASRVSAITRAGDGWQLTIRGETVQTRRVIANLLPDAIAALVPTTAPRLGQLTQRLHEGWSASMRYIGLRADADLPPHPYHLQLIVDPSQPLQEGNHLFVSVGAPQPRRTATVSTHVPVGRWMAMTAEQQASYADDLQSRISAGLARLAPELAAAEVQFPASPRTWERFTRRRHGCVGGVPRRVGLANYLDPGPAQVAGGLWLVGDSHFPGQSTFAAAIGGVRTAEAAVR